MTLMIQVLLVLISITLIISGAMILMRRWTSLPESFRDRISSSPFGFFATLYAFFLGFAIVTLWTNFSNVKFNVTWEAYSLLSSYRLSQVLPNSDKFRQDLMKYVKTVVDKEWSSMAAGSLNKEADLLIESVWTHLQELKPADKQDNPLFVSVATNLNEARRQRLSRGLSLSGNLYQPIWVIIAFGLIATVYSFYFMHPEQNLVQLIFEFMVLFTLLACIYFIIDLDTPFSGLVNVSPDAFEEVYKSMQAAR